MMRQSLYNERFLAEAYTNKEASAIWVGRELELSLLREHFSHEGTRHALISGARGTGKTALAFMFRERVALNEQFRRGWREVNYSQLFGLTIDSFSRSFRTRDSREPFLLFIDGVNEQLTNFQLLLREYINQNPTQSILLCSETPLRGILKDPLVIELGGLSQREFFELIRKRIAFSREDERDIDKLFRLVAGSPLFADLAGRTIRDQLLSINEFLQGLQSFDRSGLLGPDGKPLGRVPEEFKLVVEDTNEAILQKIKAEPELLYSIDPRKFEELVAEMLSQRGYEITLTPKGKDGGLDLYAARKDDLGSFLYLVECKRYTPPNKVGVSVVRSLHGIVQQKQANGGIIVTSSFFTKGAKEFQENLPHQLQLQDYFALQKWLGII